MYAQTNIQLFDQLQRDGYSDIELSRVANAYRMAMQLFTGLYRPSGEPFIVHQVGAASILGALRLPANVVTAGLIHAAYTHGDFGGLTKGISETKRARIKLAVGEEVEEYIARYTALEWKPRRILAIREKLATLDPIDRHVVVMRLADVLEKYQDREILYYRDLKRVRKHLDLYGDIMVETAEQLGFSRLAAELKAGFDRIVPATKDIPVELFNITGRSITDLIAPQSYRCCFSIGLYRDATKWLGSVRTRVSLRTRLRELIRQTLSLRSLFGLRAKH